MVGRTEQKDDAITPQARGTTEALLERYHTFAQRPGLKDAKFKRVAYESLRRTIGPWVPKERSARIVDVACGEGTLLLFLAECGYRDLRGFDLSPESVALCHEAGLPFVSRFDALRVGEFEPGASFDVLFALDIIEHLPKAKAAQFLRDCRERLRPGGSLVIQTPNMGCVFGSLHRFDDVSHEFCLTERSAVALMMVAGFELDDIEVRPAWNATTLLGRLREVYLSALHRLVYLAEDSSRPKIPTKNLLIRGVRR